MVTFFRLITVLKLNHDPDESLIRSALDSYQNSPELTEAILGPLIPSKVRAIAGERCYKANAHHSGQSDWNVFLSRLHSQQQQPLPGLATGLGFFDEKTGGLFDLMLFAGDTGSGKTSLVQQLALGALKQNPKVGVLHIDFEMGKDSLFRRLLSREAEIDQRLLTSPKLKGTALHATEEASRRAYDEILPRYWVEALDFRRVGETINLRWFQNTVST